MIIGIIVNLGLLGYFKYTDFLIENLNRITGANLKLLHITLPLAISFFTFQQIAYLVDSYKGQTKEYNFLNYALFVAFFPQLIAGPIVHHKEMMPQFADKKNKFINYDNIAKGLFIFSIGLFKKVIIADNLAPIANNGFDMATELNFFEGWITSLAYTFQLYFDFSGYTDMAIGSALLFNIKLPINFYSPYKALNIQEFWRRWHITLSRFLKDYVYIPLGGNRISPKRTYINIMITFLLGGLWHGAGWLFVFWGFLHGVALVIHRLWKSLNIKMHKFLAWFLTFNFVNICWIFFRAKTWNDAIKVLKAMFDFDNIVLPLALLNKLSFLTHYGVKFGGFVADLKLPDPYLVVWLLPTTFIIAVSCKNSIEKIETFNTNYKSAIFASLLFGISVLSLTKISEFLYFNF